MIRKTTQSSEKRIMNYILAQLQLRYPDSLWERKNVVAATATNSDGSSRFVRAGTPGQGDIGGCHKGRFVEFEVKRPGEKQDQDQIKRQQTVERASGVYAVCFCLADALRVVESL